MWGMWFRYLEKLRRGFLLQSCYRIVKYHQLLLVTLINTRQLSVPISVFFETYFLQAYSLGRGYWNIWFVVYLLLLYLWPFSFSINNSFFHFWFFDKSMFSSNWQNKQISPILLSKQFKEPFNLFIPWFFL